MPTVIAVECADGALVAADRVVVRGDSVASRTQNRLIDFEDCGGAAVDDPDAVRRELDAAVRTYRDDNDAAPGVDPFARMASDVVRSVGTDAAIVARDDEGVARVRGVYADGSVLEDPPIALGTGAELALGRLETVGGGQPLADATEAAREVVAGVAERDPRTGEDVDVFALENE